MVRTVGLKNYSNVHFTDRSVARDIVEFYSPSGRVLEPFKGDGAFYEPLSEHLKSKHGSGLDWCEIDEGRDFLSYDQQVDWIITNPPFSTMTEMMEKAFQISQNTVFLIPISKYFSSGPRIKLSKSMAGLKNMFHVGTGREIGFDIGFPFAAMHFQKGYKGPTFEAELADWRASRKAKTA